MGVNGTTELANMIPEIWSAKLYDELRAQIAFANIFSRQYEGEIKNLGDVVRVNQIVAPTAELLTNDKAQFASQDLTITQKTITVTKRASAAFEISDLAKLQSLEFQSEAVNALVYSIRLKMENDIISALVPSASAPDHQIAPVSAGFMAPADLATMHGLLSTSLVPRPERVLCLAPSYYSDLINSTQITSRDFGNSNSAMTGIIDQFSGFKIMEHNLLGNDIGFAVHPSALQLVMQQDVRVQISNLHSQNKYGFLISADLVYGYELFDNKRLVKISG